MHGLHCLCVCVCVCACDVDRIAVLLALPGLWEASQHVSEMSRRETGDAVLCCVWLESNPCCLACWLCCVCLCLCVS